MLLSRTRYKSALRQNRSVINAQLVGHGTNAPSQFLTRVSKRGWTPLSNLNFEFFDRTKIRKVVFAKKKKLIRAKWKKERRNIITFEIEFALSLSIEKYYSLTKIVTTIDTAKRIITCQRSNNQRFQKRIKEQ